MQRLEEEHIIPPTTVILQYPTIAVHGTPESWLSHSQIVTMASNHDDGSFEDTSSSLGDSSYDFIDDRSTVTSDDEESQSAMTQSISSDEHDIDRNNSHPPDLSSPNTRRCQSYIIQSASTCTSRGNSRQSGSELTSRGVDPDNGSVIQADTNDGQPLDQDEDKQPFIRLTEFMPAGPGKPTEGLHTLRVFTGHHVAPMFRNIFPGISPQQVTLKVKQTMVSQGLLLEKPYKVLYVGDAIAKDSIVQKVGAALAATARVDEARPSKFNVVPISSFGDTASPDVVLIDSSGLELNVDECTSATYVKRQEGKDTICMTLSDGMLVESSWSGSRFSVSDHWKLPDAAIFYLSAEDTISAKQTERFAQSFMNRHSVPAILISDVPLWSSGAGTYAIDPNTPHLLLESYSPNAGKHRNINHLPIDLPTFLQLDTGQLSRNLAYFGVHPGSSTLGTENDLTSKADDTKPKASTCDSGHYVRILDSVWKLLPPSLFILLPILLFHLIASNASRQHRILEPAISTEIPAHADTTFETTSRQPVSSIFVSPSGQSLEASRAVSSVPQPDHVPGSILSTHENTDITSYIASFLAETHPPTPNNSNKFKVHLIGDRHIVLRPPYWYTRSRRAPKLLFNVTREGSILEHEVSALFDGVYALKLRRVDAYGVLNISVWTTSRPKIHEIFQVDLKTSWLKMDGWKKAVNGMINLIREDVDFVQNNLANTGNLISRGLQALVDNTIDKATGFTKEAAGLKAASHSVSKKLRKRRATVPHNLLRHVQQLRKGFAVHASNRRAIVLRHTGRLTSGVEALVQGIERFGEEHLRKTQKSVLKAWWKISGLPKQKPVVNEARGGLYERTSMSRKRTSR